jgi:hypothetical protein
VQLADMLRMQAVPTVRSALWGTSQQQLAATSAQNVLWGNINPMKGKGAANSVTSGSSLLKRGIPDARTANVGSTPHKTLKNMGQIFAMHAVRGTTLPLKPCRRVGNVPQGSSLPKQQARARRAQLARWHQRSLLTALHVSLGSMQKRNERALTVRLDGIPLMKLWSARHAYLANIKRRWLQSLHLAQTAVTSVQQEKSRPRQLRPSVHGVMQASIPKLVRIHVPSAFQGIRLHRHSQNVLAALLGKFLLLGIHRVRIAQRGNSRQRLQSKHVKGVWVAATVHLWVPPYAQNVQSVTYQVMQLLRAQHASLAKLLLVEWAQWSVLSAKVENTRG